MDTMEVKPFCCWTNSTGDVVVSSSNAEHRPRCLSTRYTPGTMLILWAQSEGEAKSTFRRYLPKKGE